MSTPASSSKAAAWVNGAASVILLIDWIAFTRYLWKHDFDGVFYTVLFGIIFVGIFSATVFVAVKE